jgi:hypothetical protein
MWWSGVTLAGGTTALVHVTVQPLDGTLVAAHAFGLDGTPIRLSVRHGRLRLPRSRLTPT